MWKDELQMQSGLYKQGDEFAVEGSEPLKFAQVLNAGVVAAPGQMSSRIFKIANLQRLCINITWSGLQKASGVPSPHTVAMTAMGSHVWDCCG